VNTTSNVFDGLSGRLVGFEMARRNKAAEAEAVERLEPRPGDHVLAIGFGPGIGVALLAARVAHGRVIGADPSQVMIEQAAKRNRAALAAGTVELHPTTADALPCADASIDGAIAVNSVMLWQPRDASFREVARVLKPGARLVTITHGWALDRHFGSVDAFAAEVDALARQYGFTAPRREPARAERGRAVVWEATRAS